MIPTDQERSEGIQCCENFTVDGDTADTAGATTPKMAELTETLATEAASKNKIPFNFKETGKKPEGTASHIEFNSGDNLGADACNNAGAAGAPAVGGGGNPRKRQANKSPPPAFSPDGSAVSTGANDSGDKCQSASAKDAVGVADSALSKDDHGSSRFGAAHSHETIEAEAVSTPTAASAAIGTVAKAQTPAVASLAEATDPQSKQEMVQRKNIPHTPNTPHTPHISCNIKEPESSQLVLQSVLRTTSRIPGIQKYESTNDGSNVHAGVDTGNSDDVMGCAIELDMNDAQDETELHNTKNIKDDEVHSDSEEDIKSSYGPRTSLHASFDAAASTPLASRPATLAPPTATRSVRSSSISGSPSLAEPVPLTKSKSSDILGSNYINSSLQSSKPLRIPQTSLFRNASSPTTASFSSPKRRRPNFATAEDSSTTNVKVFATPSMDSKKLQPIQPIQHLQTNQGETQTDQPVHPRAESIEPPSSAIKPRKKGRQSTTIEGDDESHLLRIGHLIGEELLHEMEHETGQMQQPHVMLNQQQQQTRTPLPQLQVEQKLAGGQSSTAHQPLLSNQLQCPQSQQVPYTPHTPIHQITSMNASQTGDTLKINNSQQTHPLQHSDLQPEQFQQSEQCHQSHPSQHSQLPQQPHPTQNPSQTNTKRYRKNNNPSLDTLFSPKPYIRKKSGGRGGKGNKSNIVNKGTEAADQGKQVKQSCLDDEKGDTKLSSGPFDDAASKPLLGGRCNDKGITASGSIDPSGDADSPAPALQPSQIPPPMTPSFSTSNPRNNPKAGPPETSTKATEKISKSNKSEQSGNISYESSPSSPSTPFQFHSFPASLPRVHPRGTPRAARGPTPLRLDESLEDVDDAHAAPTEEPAGQHNDGIEGSGTRASQQPQHLPIRPKMWRRHNPIHRPIEKSDPVVLPLAPSFEAADDGAISDAVLPPPATSPSQLFSPIAPSFSADTATSGNAADVSGDWSEATTVVNEANERMPLPAAGLGVSDGHGIPNSNSNCFSGSRTGISLSLNFSNSIGKNPNQQLYRGLKFLEEDIDEVDESKEMELSGEVDTVMDDEDISFGKGDDELEKEEIAGKLLQTTAQSSRSAQSSGSSSNSMALSRTKLDFNSLFSPGEMECEDATDSGGPVASKEPYTKELGRLPQTPNRREMIFGSGPTKANGSVGSSDLVVDLGPSKQANTSQFHMHNMSHLNHFELSQMSPIVRLPEDYDEELNAELDIRAQPLMQPLFHEDSEMGCVDHAGKSSTYSFGSSVSGEQGGCLDGKFVRSEALFKSTGEWTDDPSPLKYDSKSSSASKSSENLFSHVNLSDHTDQTAQSAFSVHSTNSYHSGNSALTANINNTTNFTQTSQMTNMSNAPSNASNAVSRQSQPQKSRPMPDTSAFDICTPSESISNDEFETQLQNSNSNQSVSQRHRSGDVRDNKDRNISHSSSDRFHPAPQKTLLCPPTPARTPAWAHSTYNPNVDYSASSSEMNAHGNSFFPRGNHALNAHSSHALPRPNFIRANSLISTKVLAACPTKVLDSLSSLEDSLLENDISGSTAAEEGETTHLPHPASLSNSFAPVEHGQDGEKENHEQNMDEQHESDNSLISHGSNGSLEEEMFPLSPTKNVLTNYRQHFQNYSDNNLDKDEAMSSGTTSITMTADHRGPPSSRVVTVPFTARKPRLSIEEPTTPKNLADTTALSHHTQQTHLTHLTNLTQITSFSTDFENLGLLGSGAFADVYKVRSNGNFYAVKKSRRQFRGVKDRERAMSEVKRMQRLQSASVFGAASRVGDGANIADTNGEAQESTTTNAKSSYGLYLLFFIRAWQEDGYFFCQTELCSRATCRHLRLSLTTEWEKDLEKYPSLIYCLQERTDPKAPSTNNQNYQDPKEKKGEQTQKSKQTRLLPERAILQICHDISRGLYHIHSYGMVHYDIKPSNIFFVSYPRWGTICKIGDFGMAGDIGTTDDGQEGDTAYMPNELLTCEEKHPSADIFSLGLTLYELAASATWSLPQEGRRWHQMRASGHIPELPACRNKSLVELIKSMIRPEAQERPSAEALSESADVRRANASVDSFLSRYVNDVERYDSRRERELESAHEEAARRSSTPVGPILSPRCDDGMESLWNTRTPT